MDIKTARNLKIRRLKNSCFKILFFFCTLVGILFLIVLLNNIIQSGLKHLNWNFLNSFPSRRASSAGIKPALFGSLWLVGLTALFSIPIGVGTAIYLEEYAKNNWLNRLLQLNISNLAGVPSIVYGMLGLTLFVKTLGFGRSVLSGSLTLTLLILPVIIIASQEAIKSVPDTLRQGSLALGVTKWQTITGVVLPYAIPGILTGSIIAISRALGEAAPLVMVGAAASITFLPNGVLSSFTALPIQIFNWTSRPQIEFQEIAAAGIIVLMVILLGANAIAVFIRNKYQRRLD
jgi:phosphate transport system permease protein